MKSLSVLDTFLSDDCTKSSKFERVMIVQHMYANNRENGKIRKSSIFPIMSVCLDNHKS